VRYALAGGVLSMGAPLGLMALQRLRGVTAAFADDALVYGYVSVSTTIAFSVFGYVLGRQTERLAVLSETDPLTGLHNMRGLSQRLEVEVARWRRHRKPLAVLLIDLDGLKSINDRYGHAAGDEALRRVAAAVRNEAREGDVSGRWGGDEFVIIAAETPAPSAIALAERVRRLLSASSAPFPLTASIGVASLEHADGAERVDPELIMRVADGALYQAKMRGRNAVALAQCADGGR
jgi:diguanylate cyclase (GGDEF)-like protein